MTEVRPITGPGELEAALAVRRIVFIDEQGVPEADDLDGLDGEALQLVAIDDGRVVATCRLLGAGDAMKLQRMAVLPEARRRGLARRLIDASESQARAAGYRRMMLDAQLDARPVYRSAGYAEQGGIFLDAGIEHVRMTKDLGA
jgi:predicted GNAT family N-acyltransferase